MNITNYISISNTASGLLQEKQDLKKLNGNSQTSKTKKFKALLKKQFFESAEDSGIELNIKYEKLEKEYLIVKLQDAVYSTGDALADEVSAQNIINYKTAVKDFMNFIVENTYDVQTLITGRSNPLKNIKKKQRILVKVIDEKLDKLANDLIFNQRKKINILQRLDEIKGLLVDLAG